MLLTKHEMGAFEAKNKLSSLLSLVEAGDEVVITKRGRPVARLISAQVGHNQAVAHAAGAAFRASAAGLTLAGHKVSDLRAAGRR